MEEGESGEKTAGQEFFSLFRECTSAKQAGGVNRRRGDEAAAKKAIMKDLTNEIRSKGRMDARNRWWVMATLATDCEKASIHTG